MRARSPCQAALLAPLLAPVLATCLVASPALAQNLPGQGQDRPSTHNIRNYTLKNLSGQVITAAEARFANGQSKSVAPDSGIQPQEGQSFGEDQKACLTAVTATLKDGTRLALADKPNDCELSVIIVEPKSIVVNSSASLNRPLSN